MSEPFIVAEQKYFRLAPFEDKDPRITAGFTSREGGISGNHFNSLNMGYHVGDVQEKVTANRARLAGEIGFGLPSWCGAEQTHGTNIMKLTKEHAGMGADSYISAIKDTDGFFTDQEGLLLTMCFADCVPLYFLAPERGLAGIAHAGWKGTTAGIGSKMAERWGEEGVRPSDIFAAIGPSICKSCYIVDDRVINFAKNRLEEADKKPYNQIKEGQYELDLKELNSIILQKAGIPADNIYVSSMCTSCHSSFFSHRKDRGKTGRMMGFIGLKEEASREGIR
ncbi:peptidoglycan editing factor PgeF [Peribacillus sp. SCS-37]|uniref:peptidoglycan editing factor PgeF n=1 Tax=Paraperibacillus esterisolvens TaxID=3115296 RepID=UPI0039059EEA